MRERGKNSSACCCTVGGRDIAEVGAGGISRTEGDELDLASFLVEAWEDVWEGVILLRY